MTLSVWHWLFTLVIVVPLGLFFIAALIKWILKK